MKSYVSRVLFGAPVVAALVVIGGATVDAAVASEPAPHVDSVPSEGTTAGVTAPTDDHLSHVTITPLPAGTRPAPSPVSTTLSQTISVTIVAG